jgi:predicted DNA-binding protein
VERKAVYTVCAMPRSEHVSKLIRFPPELAEKLEAIARRERRSFTGQILLIVEQWLEQRETPPEKP